MAYNIPRMLADGVDYVDLVKIWANITEPDDWCAKWMDEALVHEKIAEEAFAQGDTITAGEAFWKASLYNHYGQFMEWDNRSRKSDAIQRKVQAYNRGAPLFKPPAERIEIPFESASLPGFLRVPTDKSNPPCVLLIGGLESTKEEYYAFENLCQRRGLATFAFDGPGQGEAYYKLKARPDFEKATSVVLDYLQNRKEINSDKFGVIGRSLGGYYAPRSAAFDKRIKACVAWAVIYDFRTWDKMSAELKNGWTYISDKKNWEEAQQFFKSFTLKGVAERISCPLYILQGKLDDICPAEQAEWLAKEAKGSTKLVIEENGTHCAHNMSHIVRPRMADWLAKTLNA
ncbi:MAG: alpha/beta hydrolase family protein [Candidatus Bathyarchaeia archaeon]